MTEPLILTLQIDEAAQSYYEGLRRKYFPPDRNFIPAHLTLFHQLPDSEHTRQAIQDIARETGVFCLKRPDCRSIGRGVAVFFTSESATALHSTLSSLFHASLIPQDRQRFRPHIVLQNKVDAGLASKTLFEVASAPPVEAQAIGLILWRYRGGPWEHVLSVGFERDLQGRFDSGGGNAHGALGGDGETDGDGSH